METMTPKERIDAVIKHQAVDRTPFTVVDGGAWIAKTEGVTYRELWVIPSLKKLKEKLPFYKYFYAHVCGASGNRVAALRECGVNVFSVDYLVDFDKAVEAAGEKMVMMGNINPAGTLLTGTPSEVYKEACERIKIANGHSHILAPGCDLGADTPLENVKMLSKACKDMT